MKAGEVDQISCSMFRTLDKTILMIDETTLAKIPGWSDVFIPPTQFYIPTDCTENHFFYEKE